MNRRFASLVVLLTLVPATAWAAPVDLVDLAPRHWAAKAVKRTVGSGILAGFPDHTFRGWKPVSRYELIGSLSKLLPDAAKPGILQTRTVVQDVPASHWAQPAVQRFQSFALGDALWSDGRLSGERPASRFDLAYATAELGAAWSLFPPLAAGFGPFEDVAPDHWAAAAVRQVKDKGLMGGRADNLFHGDDPIDRYTLAAVIDRLMSEIADAKAAPAGSDAVQEAAQVPPPPGAATPAAE